MFVVSSGSHLGASEANSLVKRDLRYVVNDLPCPQSRSPDSQPGALSILPHCLFSQNKNVGKKQSQRLLHRHKLSCASSPNIKKQNQRHQKTKQNLLRPKRTKNNEVFLEHFVHAPDSQQNTLVCHFYNCDV